MSKIKNNISCCLLCDKAFLSIYWYELFLCKACREGGKNE